MFGFFKRRKKKQEETQVQHTAPGTQIRYDPGLIDELQADHKQLLALFGRLGDTYKAGEYDKLPALLGEFGAALRGHLLKENVKLYIYLQHALAEDPENASLMQEFRSEMNGISKTVTAFLNLYSSESWDDQRREAFGSELENIGKVLIKRIETEESTLYPLYMSPEAYQ